MRIAPIAEPVQIGSHLLLFYPEVGSIAGAQSYS